MKDVFLKLMEFVSSRSPFVLIIDLFSLLIFITWIAFMYEITVNFTATKSLIDTTIQAYQHVNVKNNFDLNASIENEIKQLMLATSADRAFVNRYHDSKTDLTGDHFLFMSRSNEVESSGVTATILNNQRLPLSLFGTSEAFDSGKCLSYIEYKREDISWYDFWKDSGINSTIYCPIFDKSAGLKDRKLVGTIGVDYVIQHPDVEHKEELINKIMEVANRVSAILGVAAGKE